MHVHNDEGDCTIGKRVVILTGGRSGGHEAGVLGAVCLHQLALIMVLTCPDNTHYRTFIRPFP